MALFRRGRRPDVERMLAQRDMEGLIRALDYQDDQAVQLEAVGALAEIGADAVGPLLAAIEETPRVRAHAALAIGAIRDVRAVKPMIALLADPEREVRFLAALALGRIGETSAVGPLCEAAADPERDVREAVAWSLGVLGDARARGVLAGLLDDPDDGVRTKAKEALAGLGGGVSEPAPD